MSAAAGCPRCAAAAAAFRRDFPGLTMSTVPDHDPIGTPGSFCAVQSVEICGPATYGHPKGYVQVRRMFDEPSALDPWSPEQVAGGAR